MKTPKTKLSKEWRDRGISLFLDVTQSMWDNGREFATLTRNSILAIHGELAELAALREKYSTKCEPCWGSGSLVTEFADHTMAQSCPKCHGTGRVMMLDAEEVGARICDDPCCGDLGCEAYRAVLEGKR